MTKKVHLSDQESGLLFHRLTNNLPLVIFSLLLLGGCSSKEFVDYNPLEYIPKKKTEQTINNSPNMHRATMRPYTVLGKRYYPTKVSVNDSFSGVASWYGKKFHAKKTSNGEYYNMYAMTAAHKTLPMNTMLRVTNLKNNRKIVVRVNDRGPFVKSRIIDLSYEGAKRIDMIREGTAPVRLDVIGFNGIVGDGGSAQKSSVVMDDYMVQIGAFSKKDRAYRFAQKNRKVAGGYTSTVIRGTKDEQLLYRVYLKGFHSEPEARDFIARGDFSGAYVVRE